jgi:biotin synthase
MPNTINVKNMNDIRHDWKFDEVLALFEAPWEEIRALAKLRHQTYAALDLQKCKLLSVKTGGCPEDCGYCSQSAHFKTQLDQEPLMSVEKVIREAKQAKEGGATRFCMGAAWRQIPDDYRFSRIVSMVEGVAQFGMEVCCTFGMATADQLTRLKEAGLTAYNHNLDTSREHYDSIVSTRTYDDRLATLRAARTAGVQVCCGGILGMGESVRDRAMLLQELACLTPHPESVPINLLVPILGTPLEHSPSVSFVDFLRTVAVARILMPQSRVRLSAGRNRLSESEQLECFEVGANSIFVGEKLLTTPNVDWEKDRALVEKHRPQTAVGQASSRP